MQSFDALLIDAGTGNLHSVYNALLQLGFKIQVSKDPEDIFCRSGRIFLPGVGAFGSFMQGLNQYNLIEALRTAFRRGDPILGICVGMQALFEIGEESGEHAGLALLPGRVVRFPDFEELKVPHTGWNQLWFDDQALLFQGMPAGIYAYFNHSYYCANAETADSSSTTDYGFSFTSSVQHDNLFGVQFHPEKSQRVGQQVLANFFKV